MDVNDITLSQYAEYAKSQEGAEDLYKILYDDLTFVQAIEQDYLDGSENWLFLPEDILNV